MFKYVHIFFKLFIQLNDIFKEESDIKQNYTDKF